MSGYLPANARPGKAKPDRVKKEKSGPGTALSTRVRLQTSPAGNPNWALPAVLRLPAPSRAPAGFTDEQIKADLASILGPREGWRSPIDWLIDYWYRPEITVIWEPPPSWRDNLRWYILAFTSLQVILFLSLIMRETSLADDWRALAVSLGL